MDTRREVKVFRVQRGCAVAGCTGVLIHSGPAHVGRGGTLYEHVCQRCGNTTMETGMFPLITYEEVS